MSNGTSDGERRDDAFVERLGDRISGSPGDPRPGAPKPAPVMRPGDFGEESTLMSSESEPPPPLAGTLPPPAEGSGLFDALQQPPPSRPDDAFAEFEASEMPGESTRIEESEIIADQSTAILDEGPKMPLLFVESGKDKGKEYVLQEGETGVGRGIDNDVILTDVSVSRKHLRVLRDGPSLVLRDLGSGNGTTVNGKRVHQIPLTEGDRIELGETVLVVKLPAEAAHAPASPMSGHTSERVSPPDAGAPAMIPAWTAPMPPPISSSSETVAPRDGNTATVRLPRRTLVFAVAGIAAMALFVGVGVGAMMLVAGRGATTSTPLPITPSPSVPMPTGVPVIGPTVVAAPPATVALPATAIVMAPPATGIPVLAPPSSVVLLGPAAPIEVTSATPPATVAVEDTAPSDATPARTGRGARPTREAAAPTGSAQARVTAAYNSGDFDGASAIARDAARHATGGDQRTLESLANNIDSFAGLYPRIHAAGDALGPVAGIVPIALRLDRQIVSGGHYAREIQPRYVRYLVTQARAQIGSAPQTACPRVRDALDLEAGNADAQALARQCETAASRMLSDAQAHERSDAAGAQRSYTTIQTMVPRTSATYRTAGERLTALRRAPAPTTTGPRVTTVPRRMDEDE
jgi:pSer/pThr/pTyr-binding forkhead associated (FHA) protein